MWFRADIRLEVGNIILLVPLVFFTNCKDDPAEPTITEYETLTTYMVQNDLDLTDILSGWVKPATTLNVDPVDFSVPDYFVMDLRAQDDFEQMAERFPHWMVHKENGQASHPSFDQHHLLSSIAPRGLYLAAASADLWADPMGSYQALKQASQFWNIEHSQKQDWPEARDVWISHGRVANGALGYHMRPGGHDMLPYDWRKFLEFLGTVSTFKSEAQGA